MQNQILIKLQSKKNWISMCSRALAGTEKCAPSFNKTISVRSVNLFRKSVNRKGNTFMEEFEEK
jgi:hypothetical protein